MQQSTKSMFLAAVLAAALFAQRPFGVLTTSTPPDPATIVQNQVARLTALLPGSLTRVHERAARQRRHIEKLLKGA